jgi:nucleolar protein 4
MTADASKTTPGGDAAGKPARENVMVFVRNLPYDADDAALEETFSNEFGPVKEAWVVREKGSSTHRGFGYVKFAIGMDARDAVERSGKIELGGRKLAVVFAKKKEPTVGGGEGKTRDANGAEDDDDADGPADEAKRRAEKEDAEEKKRERERKADIAKRERVKKSTGGGVMASGASTRTVVVGGLKLGGEIEGVDKEAALELAREVGEVESVTDPCPDDLMKLAKIREDGCARGALLVAYKDEATALEAVRALHRKCPKGKKRKGKKANAGADADEPKEAIWARMLAGEGSKPKQWRVILRNLSFKATEESIREALGAAGFIWDVNVPKDFHHKPKGFAFVTYTCKADADKAVSECNGVSIEGRQVAVDIAVSKTKYQQGGGVDAAAATEEEEEKPSADGSDSESDSDSDSGGSGSSSSSSSSSSSESEDEEAQEKSMMSRLLGKVMADAEPSTTGKERASKPIEKKKREVAAPVSDGAEPSWQGKKGVNAENEDEQENATVFVRNLPLEATWQQLKEKMLKYGKVKSCRVVKDKVTGKHKGTAFVDFVKQDAAEAAVEASGKESAGIYVAGKPIVVALALSKVEAADMMARQGSKYRNANKHRDNRNLYLSQEGDIHEASAAADGVSKSDIEKRRRSNEERQLKLKNPNYFISRTRLSVRNIPPEVDSKALKKMFMEAVQQRATQAVPKILHAKLLYDNTKSDENGKPRSKGMGFVEFTQHEHALNALRALNNNPDAFSRARRPIVEFAIEDARAVRKLELKAKQRDERFKKRDGEDKPRGAEQAAKRVAAKEKKSPRAESSEPNSKGSKGKRGRDAAEDVPSRGESKQPAKKKAPKSGDAASKLQQRAADAQRRDKKDEDRKRRRENTEAAAPKKKAGADKRDRTDDLIDTYFSANKADNGLKSWL